MNILTKLNSFHGLYLKSKYVFLTLFGLLVVLAFVSSTTAYGSGVVDTVETKIKLEDQGKIKTIITTQNTVKSALEMGGFALAENSITEPVIETPLNGGVVDVKVVPAVPVLIADGNQYWVGKSAYTQPGQILKQLKVEVAPEDMVSSELISDPVETGVVGQKVSIKRAPTFTVIADGEEKVIHSWAKTISEVLTEKNYILRQNDIVEPAKDATSVGVDTIEITRINYEDIEEVVPIEYKSITQTDYNMYKGQSKVTQAGVNGSKKQSVHIVYENNVEVSRTVISVEVISSPIEKITVVGVKPYNAGMWWDTIVAASQKYGVDPNKMYNVMICESGGDPTRVSSAGYVGLFQWDTSFSSWSAKAGFAGASRTDGTAQIYTTAYRASLNGWAAWGACQYR
jgi:uncharacterized protein YabE (DUF348 family)